MLTFICIVLSLSTYIQYITQNIMNSTTHSNFKKCNSFATNKNNNNKNTQEKSHKTYHKYIFKKL